MFVTSVVRTVQGLGRCTASPLLKRVSSGSARQNVSLVSRMSTIVVTKDLERAQKSQEVSLRENCILVDVHDRATGHASKRDCHRVGDNGSLLLHRAFSVFLFNTKGEMLVQRRSSHKVGSKDLVFIYILPVGLLYSVKCIRKSVIMWETGKLL